MMSNKGYQFLDTFQQISRAVPPLTQGSGLGRFSILGGQGQMIVLLLCTESCATSSYEVACLVSPA